MLTRNEIANILGKPISYLLTGNEREILFEVTEKSDILQSFEIIGENSEIIRGPPLLGVYPLLSNNLIWVSIFFEPFIDALDTRLLYKDSSNKRLYEPVGGHGFFHSETDARIFNENVVSKGNKQYLDIAGNALPRTMVLYEGKNNIPHIITMGEIHIDIGYQIDDLLDFVYFLHNPEEQYKNVLDIWKETSNHIQDEIIQEAWTSIYGYNHFIQNLPNNPFDEIEVSTRLGVMQSSVIDSKLGLDATKYKNRLPPHSLALPFIIDKGSLSLLRQAVQAVYDHYQEI